MCGGRGGELGWRRRPRGFGPRSRRVSCSAGAVSGATCTCSPAPEKRSSVLLAPWAGAAACITARTWTSGRCGSGGIRTNRLFVPWWEVRLRRWEGWHVRQAFDRLIMFASPGFCAYALRVISGNRFETLHRLRQETAQVKLFRWLWFADSPLRSYKEQQPGQRIV